jgi:hypothetical protein
MQAGSCRSGSCRRQRRCRSGRQPTVGRRSGARCSAGSSAAAQVAVGLHKPCQLLAARRAMGPAPGCCCCCCSTLAGALCCVEALTPRLVAARSMSGTSAGSAEMVLARALPYTLYACTWGAPRGAAGAGPLVQCCGQCGRQAGPRGCRCCC